MPNWCSCSLNIENAPEIADAIRQLPLDPEGHIKSLFHRFVPMPAVFNDIHAGGATASDGTRCSYWRQIDNKIVPLTQDEIGSLMATHGAVDMVDWAIANWGTKWEADLARFSSDPNRVLFSTAWCPPLPFILKLSAQYPHARITLAYCEMGHQFWGAYVAINGQLDPSSIDRDDFFDRKKYDALPEDHDDEQFFATLVPALREHLETYELDLGG